MRSTLISNRLITILLAGLLLPAAQAFGESQYVTENSKAASMNSCVAPTEVMRRNHMDFLKHGRDDTVRDGIRGLKYSLSECIDCHASRDSNGQAVSVTSEGEFCQVCHGYVAVSPACFQCHRTTPMESGSGKPLGYHSDVHTQALDMQQPSVRQRD
jgi:hypothetical protein